MGEPFEVLWMFRRVPQNNSPISLSEVEIFREIWDLHLRYSIHSKKN